MKNLLAFCLLLSFLLLSCNNLDDINERLDYLESQKDIHPKDTVRPTLELIKFLVSDNPLLLMSDVTSEEIVDSVVECWVPYLMSSKILQPVLKYVGDSVYVDGKKYGGGHNRFQETC